MLIGPIPKNVIKVYPCDQTECYFFTAWGLMHAKRADAYILIKPDRASDCEYCKHFKGFDLSRGER